jgi:ribonucleoside-diphosphate reductase alpha chain
MKILAQMQMMADWHPDIIEFIISKMQNPKILQAIIANTKDKQIKIAAKNKLKFEPLTQQEKQTYNSALKDPDLDEKIKKDIENKLTDGGKYTINNPEFLTGANISVCLTDEFMDAVEKNKKYALRFPDTENYTKEEMKFYNENWHKYGDVREWEALGYKVKTYRTIRAKDLWNLINICATYSAEPGIFFMDNANNMTNAKAYGQKVVATNPCGKCA